MEEKINVLILGGGGREHAIAWKVCQSSSLNKLFVAPGNAGTQVVAINLDIKETDFPAIKSAIIEHNIHLLIVGPEAPLVKGIREYIESDLETENVRIIGPSRAGAKLEGSKSYSKDFMQRHSIPTARYGKFNRDSIQSAKEFLSTMEAPYVLKADGLAGGKGVLILEDLKEAYQALEAMLKDGKFGNAGESIVIEEFLEGIELSVFLLTDGNEYVLFPSAKDYKRIGEGDTGLNTGGMGSICPVPFADVEFMNKVKDRVINPTINGLRSEGVEYVGFIFIGLMNVGGDPYVIEYNCRMGDPETESVMPRIKSDLLPILWQCAGKELEEQTLEEIDQVVASVMLVSGGYPEAYEKGKFIYGLNQVENSIVFHAGTKISEEHVVTNGGRVLTLTAFGQDLNQALSAAYNDAQKVSFEAVYYRRDLGFDLN